eukprot:sb/3464894/
MHGALVTEGNDGIHRNITAEEAQDLYTKYYQLVCSASIVILMQLGFTFLEVGSVRVHFTKAILMKNMIDMLISGLAYYALGFGIAFGDGSAIGGFAGLSDFFLVRENKSETDIHTSSADFCMHSRTPIHQAKPLTPLQPILAPLCEDRSQSHATSISLRHPCGQAKPFPPSIPVNRGHTVSTYIQFRVGISLVVCRYSRYSSSRSDSRTDQDLGLLCLFWGCKNLEKQNQAFIVFGMFVLWFSWYSFNAGPAILKAGSEPGLIGNIATYTTVCAASSGLSYLLVSLLWERRTPEPCDLSNGILAGLVCSTSGCSRTQPYFGMIVGSVGGALMLWASKGCDQGGKQLLSNVLVIILTYIYITAIMVPVCFGLRHFQILRVDVEAEKKGVDLVEFQGPAYSNKHNASRRGNKKHAVAHRTKSEEVILNDLNC